MPQPVHTQGLVTVEFDWELFDKQPHAIKELTWYAVGNGVSFPFVIPERGSESLARLGRQKLAMLIAVNARETYGPDHPQATWRARSG